MEKRFVYRGNAVGASAHIHRPEDIIIWVQGASSLPVVGGYSRSVAERLRCSDVMTVDHVRTHTSGDFNVKTQSYTTLANSVVKGLNVHGRLTADILEATLTSIHHVDGGEPTISPTGTEIVNLRLDGHPITFDLDKDLFTHHAKKSDLAHAYAKNDAFYAEHKERFLTSDKDKRDPASRDIPTVEGYVVTTIVSHVKTDHPRAVVNGNVITLEGFGRIFLGELLITEVSRRLTLVRLKLGSPIEGDVACAEVESNGIIMF